MGVQRFARRRNESLAGRVRPCETCGATVRLEDIERALAIHQPTRPPLQRIFRKAAVAAIFRTSSTSTLELLFIRRAEHPRDPWSGHMAFPGGRMDPVDRTPLDAAVRETREELGLDLERHGQNIGALSPVPATAHGKPVPLIISPFVFSVGEAPPLALNHEVQEVVWIPISFFLDPRHRTHMRRAIADVPVTLPCYNYQSRCIWGLTLRMVDELLAILRGLAATRT
ncbi:MAG: CoA pyrophosphatase [Deltaproteobacteria bacterium]|nr:CoA pyrophosphatase [Deltaproteobacteria bacterium]